MMESGNTLEIIFIMDSCCMWNKETSHVKLWKRIRQNDIHLRENVKPRKYGKQNWSDGRFLDLTGGTALIMS